LLTQNLIKSNTEKMSVESNKSEHETNSPIDQTFWSTENGQAALKFFEVFTPLDLKDQFSSPESDDDNNSDDDSIQATIVSRNLLMLDEVQQKEIVTKGIQTVEDQLFSKVSSGTYNFMNLLEDSANHPLSSYIATFPESHYWNNIEISQQKMKALGQIIKDEALCIEKNERSLYEADEAIIEATRTRDELRARLAEADRILEVVHARRDGYAFAAEKTTRSKHQHKLDKKVLAIMQQAMEHVVRCYQTKSTETLPYSKFSVENHVEQAKIFGLSDYNSVPNRVRQLILIARALKTYGYENSPCARDYGKALKMNKGENRETLKEQTCKCFGIAIPRNIFNQPQSLKRKFIIESPKLIKCPKRNLDTTSIEDFMKSPQGKALQKIFTSTVNVASQVQENSKIDAK